MTQICLCCEFHRDRLVAFVETEVEFVDIFDKSEAGSEGGVGGRCCCSDMKCAGGDVVVVV